MFLERTRVWFPAPLPQAPGMHAGKKLKIYKINLKKKKILKHRHGEMTKWVKAIAAQAKQPELICRTYVKVGARAPKLSSDFHMWKWHPTHKYYAQNNFKILKCGVLLSIFLYMSHNVPLTL